MEVEIEITASQTPSGSAIDGEFSLAEFKVIDKPQGLELDFNVIERALNSRHVDWVLQRFGLNIETEKYIGAFALIDLEAPKTGEIIKLDIDPTRKSLCQTKQRIFDWAVDAILDAMPHFGFHLECNRQVKFKLSDVIGDEEGRWLFGLELAYKENAHLCPGQHCGLDHNEDAESMNVKARACRFYIYAEYHYEEEDKDSFKDKRFPAVPIINISLVKDGRPIKYRITTASVYEYLYFNEIGRSPKASYANEFAKQFWEKRERAYSLDPNLAALA